MITKAFTWMVIALSVTGCAIGTTSQAPIATTYEYTTQQKMQAAHHWNVLAKDVASRLKEHIDKSSAAGRTINVISDNKIPFDNAFEDLLITQMVNNGLDIRDNNHGKLKLKFNTQVINHNDRGFIRPAQNTHTKLALLATGVWAAINIAHNATSATDSLIAVGVLGTGMGLDATVGNITSISNKEVIINVSLMDGDKYVMRKTGIYYINEPDDTHYITPNKRIPVVSE